MGPAARYTGQKQRGDRSLLAFLSRPTARAGHARSLSAGSRLGGVHLHTVNSAELFCTTTTSRRIRATIDKPAKAVVDGVVMSNVALNVVASAGRIPTKSVTVTDDDLLSHTHLDAAS